jgi:hypothetical protein
MGFMKLLGTSEAFGRILDRPSRYRLDQQSLLPKFGGEKRPEAVVTQAVQAPTCAPASQTGSARPVTTGAPKRGLLSRIFRRRTNKTMNTVEADPSMASASAPSKPEHAFPFGRWTLFRSPFNRVPAATPKPKSDAGPVQGELLLDAVKPVRNDLSDSDLEVVESASQKACETGACLAVPIAGNPDPALPAWRQVAAQFSDAEKP